jgi:uncharacterized Zn finger protein
MPTTTAKELKCPVCGKSAKMEKLADLLQKELVTCSECGVVFVSK